MAEVASIDSSLGSDGSSDISGLIGLTSSDMERVDALIFSRMDGDIELISSVARHLLDSGGKRLRAMLTLGVSHLCGYDGDGHIPLAAAVELMHNAMLLHDDVVDESDLRRGVASARVVWGNQSSVLVGDFLFGQAFRMMVDAGSLTALDVLSEAATIIARGEVMQLSAAKNVSLRESEYFSIIESKTATLFAAATEMGPILSGRDSERSLFRSYGMNLGMAFQLVDDALDYGGSSSLLGKNVGDDFVDGKLTLPVLLAYERGDESERKFWSDAFGGDSSSRSGSLDSALELLSKHDAISDTVLRARHYGDLACDSLSSVPDSEYKRALLDAVDFCVCRVT